MSFYLKILNCPVPDKIGLKIELGEGENLVGRASPPCEIQFEGGKVSKKHCSFHVKSGALSVKDLNSANGVFVNGKQVSDIGLKAKDRIVIGDFILEVTEK